MSLALVASAAVFAACSPSGAASIPPGWGESTSNGGSTGAGGSSAAGGNQSAAGISSIGGASTAQAGGAIADAGSSNPGGGASSGGIGTTGGTTRAGGSTITGGSRATGGVASTGGSKATGGMVSTGGSKATGGAVSTGGSKATGGMVSTGGASSTGGSSDNAFSWGTNTYNVTGGSSIGYQTHEVGTACLASCHNHSFTTGGTIYQASGTTAASNVEIGIIVNGTLYTTYSGSGGNFYLTIPGTVDWTTAQIAIRTSNGTAVHPATTGLNGNCNSGNCHSSSNRIVVP